MSGTAVTTHEVRRFNELYKAGASIGTIAETTHRRMQTVRRHLRALGHDTGAVGEERKKRLRTPERGETVYRLRFVEFMSWDDICKQLKVKVHVRNYLYQQAVAYAEANNLPIISGQAIRQKRTKPKRSRMFGLRMAQ